MFNSSPFYKNIHGSKFIAVMNSKKVQRVLYL